MFSLPELSYQPVDPKEYRPAIGLIGCGAITGDHLTAYKSAGYNVAALCDVDRAAAVQRKKAFFPDADIFDDHRKLLARDDIDVVDLATHPRVREQLLPDAIEAGKHVLSQKPFVVDIDFGSRMVEKASKKDVKLAVNQNGRWAPHFCYIRRAIAAGLVGEVQAVHFAVHWDHSWVAGTEFEKIRHLILYDFAIHWFDMLCCIMGPRSPVGVFASMQRSAAQTVGPALLAQAAVRYQGAQASLVFDGDTRTGKLDSTYIVGSEGTIRSSGPDLNHQTVTLSIGNHEFRPVLSGRWFPDGFHGTMAELLCAIEEDREPENSAANNIKSLELCFAAVASAESLKEVVPGTVRRLSGS